MSVTGRFFLTYQTAKPYELSQANLPLQLFVRLDSHVRVSTAEADKVISFDLSQPEDLDLFIELRNDTSGESIGSAKYNIADVLHSGQETCITLELLSPDDKTVVSTMNFKLSFVMAKIGSIKLRLGAENSDDVTRVVLSLPDGQSSTLVDHEVSFSVDHSNCFWDFTVQLYNRNASFGYGKLSLLSCLGGHDNIQHDTSTIPIKVGGDTQQTYEIAIDHWFVGARKDDIVQNEEQEVVNNVDEDCFTDNAIQAAFNFFDLDNNSYIGVAELKHILIMMGEIVSDEELDMMISMLDINGDGQVGFQEFKAMVESPDPANEDFLVKQNTSTEKNHQSPAMKQRHELVERKRELFSRILHTSDMDMEFVYSMLTSFKGKSTVEEFAINYQELCELLPATLGYSPSDCKEVFVLLRDGDSSTVDGRDVIMTFVNLVDFTLEAKCKIAFQLYDVDRSGYLSGNEIEAIIKCTNAAPNLVKKRAETFMNCADIDRSGGITIDELIAAAEKLPTLLFPTNHSSLDQPA